MPRGFPARGQQRLGNVGEVTSGCLKMPFPFLATLTAYHDGGTHGASTSVTGMLVVLGILMTVGWLVFSQLEFRATVGLAAGAWVVGIAALVFM